MSKKFPIIVDFRAAYGGRYVRVRFNHVSSPNGQALTNAIRDAKAAHDELPPKGTRLGWLHTDDEGRLDHVELHEEP